jgi:peptidoglycan/LPS O-acetylase OafA/YrhL
VRKRYQELDALRGIAALTVLMYHYLLILPGFDANTSVYVLGAGYEAVLFFFVLSGFVLSLKFFAYKQVTYKSFVIKRFLRIYVPYYGILALALTLYTLLSRQEIPELSSWFNSIWVKPVTFKSVINHLVLIRPFGYGQYIPVLWSLAVEMRMSLIFPLLMIGIKKYDWKISLLVGIGLAAMFYENLAYGWMFILGALLAKHRKMFSGWMKKIPTWLKTILLIVSWLLYTVRYWAVGESSSLTNDVLICVGIALVIILALTTRLSGYLRWKPLLFLGKISYSLYLSHAVVLMAVVYMLYPRVPMYVIWLISCGVTLGVSMLSYKYLELPAIKMGCRI